LTSGEIERVRLVGPIAPAIGGLAGEPRGLEVELVDHTLEAVVGLRDRRRVEGAGLDEVAARLEIGLVDLADHLGAGEDEDVVVALEVVPMGTEARTAERGLVEAAALHHGSHRAVEHEDPAAQERGEPFGDRVGRHGFSRSGLWANAVTTFRWGSRRSRDVT
jgi:hypothetical protein